MKNLRFVLAVIFILSAAFLANAQTDEMTQKLALRLVQSASVRPGDVVMITGGKHMIPLMEAVAIEVQKAGGFQNMILNTDRVTRFFYTEVPDKYLEQEPRYWAEWLKQTNVFIGLPSTEDNKALIERESSERFAKISKGGELHGDISEYAARPRGQHRFSNKKRCRKCRNGFSSLRKNYDGRHQRRLQRDFRTGRKAPANAQKRQTNPHYQPSRN